MVMREVTDRCSICHRGWTGPSDQVAKQLAKHAFEEHPDPLLVEAMREVDALTPAAPPIAPRPSRPVPPPLPAPNLDLFPTIWK